MPAQRVLLVVAGFFCLKTAVRQDYRKKFKKSSKRGQIAESRWLVVCVDGKEDKI